MNKEWRAFRVAVSVSLVAYCIYATFLPPPYLLSSGLFQRGMFAAGAIGFALVLSNPRHRWVQWFMPLASASPILRAMTIIWLPTPGLAAKQIIVGSTAWLLIGFLIAGLGTIPPIINSLAGIRGSKHA
jgi:hypothetical protein